MQDEQDKSLTKPSKSKTQPTQSVPNLESQYATDRVIEMVTQCFNSLNNFGKTPEQLPSIVKMFVMVLQKYDVELIKSGFLQYISRNSVMPTPADIVNIIDPPVVAWKPDWPLYISLKQKVQREGYYIWGKERQFIQRCEQHVLDRATAPDREPLEIEPKKLSENDRGHWQRRFIDDCKNAIRHGSIDVSIPTSKIAEWRALRPQQIAA